MCTVCILRCEHNFWWVEDCYGLHINFHSLIHSFKRKGHNLLEQNRIHRSSSIHSSASHARVILPSKRRLQINEVKWTFKTETRRAVFLAVSEHASQYSNSKHWFTTSFLQVPESGARSMADILTYWSLDRRTLWRHDCSERQTQTLCGLIP